MTRRTDCGRYPKCLNDAAHTDLWELPCGSCADYIHIENHPSLADLAGALALILSITNPDLESRLPPDKKWKWDLLALFHNIRERNEQAGADATPARPPAR